MCEQVTIVWVGEYPGLPKTQQIAMCSGQGEDDCGFYLDGIEGVYDAEAEGGYISYPEMQEIEELHRGHSG